MAPDPIATIATAANVATTFPPTTDVVPGTATTAQKSPKSSVSKSYTQHPLDPLTPDEITSISLSIRSHIATNTPIKAVKFITCYLIPPPKKAVLALLGIPIAPGEKPETINEAEVYRRAEVDFIDLITGDAHNYTVELQDQNTQSQLNWSVIDSKKLPEGTQPQISVEELVGAELAVRNDERVRALAKEVGIEPHQIFADGWSIGYDERFPKHQRIQQGLLFARFSQHENLYAHPMDFIPVLDSNTMKVIHIDFPAHRLSASGTLSNPSTIPPPLSSDSFAESKRERIPPPLERFDFLPDLIKEKEGDAFKMRDDVKPLHILQPEGVSFKMDGHVLEWQKWKMHIAFSHREGIAISTVTYNDDGEIRPLFYRLSLAEMVVPYGAPEHPHPRKFAFDEGEYGMGTQANDLTLGCDCLGQIHYLPGSYIGNDGSAVIIKQAICIHEEDSGLLWKHTDFRPGGRSQAVRRRRLVVSMCCTLANYEYIWNYLFYQDGSIEFEVRLTGILQVYLTNENEPNPYGTTIAPRISAQNHQHIFCLRIDPMIDGLKNSVIETDIIPTPNAPTGSKENYAGNAFIAHDKLLKIANEGARNYSLERERRWRIVNHGRKHYSTGADVGYAIIMKCGVVGLMPREDGWVARRAKFSEKPVWVVRDREGLQGGRIWPAGKYVPQTREEPEESIGKWAQGTDSIENEDILCYLTFGTTHIARPEDWPVMPTENITILLRPQSFFKYNPSMDVPGANDSHSKPAFSANGANGTNGTADHDGVNGTNGSSCCD